LALARAIIRQVKFIIMDEGTSALDDENAIEIEKNLVLAEDLCVIFITHHLKDVIREKLNDVYPMQSKEKVV
jgi:ATP-binding cassette subfamily B protein